MEYKGLSVIARVAAGIILLCALGNWPYGYFQLLRIVVCASSFLLVWYFKEVQLNIWSWIFIVPGILFNPIYPIYLDKQLWHTMDVGLGLLFLVSLAAEGKKQS